MHKLNKIYIFFLIVLIIQIFYLFQFRSNFKYEVIKNPFGPDAGIIYAVSAEVIESNKILKKNKIKEFNLSESIKKDTYLYQRFIEFNYPLRVNDSTDTYLYLSEEKISDNCTIVDSLIYLKVVNCI